MTSARFLYAGFSFHVVGDAAKDRVLRACEVAGVAARAVFLRKAGGWLFNLNGCLTDADGPFGPEATALARELIGDSPYVSLHD